MIRKAPVITIDGPAASGKGTLANTLSAKLGWHQLDSGLLYRIVAYLANHWGIDPSDARELGRCLSERLTLNFFEDERNRSRSWTTNVEVHEQENQAPRIYLDQADVTIKLRSESISKIVSRVATHTRNVNKKRF